MFIFIRTLCCKALVVKLSNLIVLFVDFYWLMVMFILIMEHFYLIYLALASMKYSN